MSLRVAPSVISDKVESHPARVKFICDRIDVPPVSGGVPGDKWAHVVEVNGAAKDLWVAQVHNGVTYCTSRPIQSTTNPRATFSLVDQNGVLWEATDVELIRRS